MIELQNEITSKTIHLAMAVFENILPLYELPQFRGAIIERVGRQPLFHNHSSEGYTYRYPLIQYKLFDGHPAVLGIEEGASIVSSTFSTDQSFNCRIGRHSQLLKVSSVGQWTQDVGVSDEFHSYAIENWIPLNAENFRLYQHSESAIERIQLLQQMLVGNILSFAKGLNIFFDSEIKCVIRQISAESNINYKGVDLLGFSASFKTNVRLPQWIGLGKSASLNHGIIIHL